jgi:N-acetylglutamate synthase-like GNAT family acetyltransferase
MTIMRVRYASDDGELPDSARFFTGSDTETVLVEEEGEIIGSATYSEDNGLGSLEYVNIDDAERGRGLGSALVDRVLEEADTWYVHATAMDGKMQSILQNRGFEASGLEADKRVSEPQPHSSGGFNLNFWKMDEEVQAYIPEELRGFTEKSLGNQRNIDYLEPDSDQVTGSFEIVRSKLTGNKFEKDSKRTNRLKLEVGEGSTLETHIRGAIEALDSDEFWAKTVKLDTSQPVSYELAKNLYQRGFKPVNMSPSEDGQELTMLDFDIDAGVYSVTDETLELIDATGLNYSIEGYDDQTTQIIFQPNHESKNHNIN